MTYSAPRIVMLPELTTPALCAVCGMECMDYLDVAASPFEMIGQDGCPVCRRCAHDHCAALMMTINSRAEVWPPDILDWPAGAYEQVRQPIQGA